MIKLNLGCGMTNFGDGWINIDQIKAPHIKYHNITKLPFKDNSVDLVYSSHTLEYFDRQEVIPILKEWRRVLKKNGILRLAVPDFIALSHIVLYSPPFKIENILGPLYGKMSIGKNKYIYHKTVYTYDSLRCLLEKIGFKDIHEWNWKLTPPHDEIDDCSAAHWPHSDLAIKTRKFSSRMLISLNIEATK